MTTPTATLNAFELTSKFGFRDGDILMKTFPNVSFTEEWDGQNSLQRATLVRLVLKHLGPLLPGVELTEIGTCHNPIRVSSYFDDDAEYWEAPDVGVTVTQADVELAKAEVLAGVKP